MELKQVIAAVWRHRVLALAMVVLTGVGVAVGVDLAPKEYVAVATVSAAASPAAASGGEDLDSLRGTLAELVNSEAVVDDVASRLTEPRSRDQLRQEITGSWSEGTILVQIEVHDADPTMAAEIANTVADVLPLHDPSNGSLLYTTSNPAQPPKTFDTPNLLLAIGAGAALAVVLAVGAALLRDRRATKLGDASELEEVAGAPVLAHVARPKDPTTLPALYPGTAAAHVFRQLRIALEAQASTDPVSLVVVAGVTAGDEPVWLGANLGISLATVGRRVLLVDGRMGDRDGRPIAAGPDTVGLYGVLNGADLGTAMSPGPTPHLSVLPAGDWKGEPAEALLETNFAAAMARAAARFDIVVVLAPPLDTCDDARVMAANGSLLLVVSEDEVGPAEMRSHVDRVRAVGIRLLGTVLVGKHAEPVPA